MMEKAKENTGKTFQMPSSDLFMAYEIENIPRMLSLLQQYPLFLITKKNKDGSYSLRSHPFTMKKLGWSNTTKDDILTYKHEDGKKQIRLSPRRNMAKNFVILTEKDGSYTLE